MAAHPYLYSLRRGDEIVATGHLLSEHRIEVGDEISVGPHRGVVVSVEQVVGGVEEQLVLELRNGS